MTLGVFHCSLPYSFCLLENLIHVNNEIWSDMSPCPSSSSLHGHLYTFPLLFHVFVLFFLSLNNPVNLVGAADTDKGMELPREHETQRIRIHPQKRTNRLSPAAVSCQWLLIKGWGLERTPSLPTSVQLDHALL